MRIAQEKKKEDNSSSLQKSDSERHLISSTCLKMFLSVGITVLVVTVIALILLVLASLGLSRAKENTAKYQELQHTAEKMAVKVLVLEEQLNSSVTTNEIIARQMAGKILTLEEQLHSSVTANGNVFDTLERLMEQIRDLYNTQSDLMAKSDVLSRNLSSSTNKLNQTLTSHIITFNGEVDQLNTHIATANSAVGELTDRVDDLNNSLERVENYTKKLSEDTEKLNSTLLQLTSTNNTVPRNCISHINQSTALNTTNVTSPSVDWDSDRVSIINKQIVSMHDLNVCSRDYIYIV
jgi:chromosome segregation ATPase